MPFVQGLEVWKLVSIAILNIVKVATKEDLLMKQRLWEVEAANEVEIEETRV